MGRLHYFDIDDEFLADIKGNFNKGINQILDGMEKKNVCEGDLTIGVKISLLKVPRTDADGDEESVTVPVIKHKVVTKMSVKNEEKGEIGFSDGNGRLRHFKVVDGRYAVEDIPIDGAQLVITEGFENA